MLVWAVLFTEPLPWGLIPSIVATYMKYAYHDFFKNKKITLMGLGLLGRGVGDAAFLAECGAELLVTDLKSKEQLTPSLKKLSKYKNIVYVLGEHRLQDFRDRDLVIKSGNIPLDSEYIAEAKRHGVRVTTAEALFLEHAPGVLSIGITGTRGKTTVTHVIYEMVKASGRKVFLGGNVRGVATLPLLTRAKSGDVVVMELDSWRLQGLHEWQLSPQIAVFTNFMADHQNYYKGDMNAYFADKANIFAFQKAVDTLVVTKSVATLIKSKGVTPKSKIIISGTKLPPGWKCALPGAHNTQNVLLALRAARAAGVPESVCRKVLARFEGVPGRLETVGVKKGVLYINDTTATTPDAAVAALEAFKKYAGKILLIGGGADKALDYAQYGRVIPKYIKTLVLFEGIASDKIVAALPTRKNFFTGIVDSMKDAVSVAEHSAEKGDLVLLSPGAASFGIFKNEYDRGDQFVKLVKKIR